MLRFCVIYFLLLWQFHVCFISIINIICAGRLVHLLVVTSSSTLSAYFVLCCTCLKVSCRDRIISFVALWVLSPVCMIWQSFQPGFFLNSLRSLPRLNAGLVFRCLLNPTSLWFFFHDNLASRCCGMSLTVVVKRSVVLCTFRQPNDLVCLQFFPKSSRLAYVP